MSTARSGTAEQCELRVDSQALTTFAARVFEQAGVAQEDALVVAKALVWANLRGVDSHGVMRIPSYVEYIESGRMNPRPKLQVLKETAAILSIEADRAIGAVATVAIMRRVIEKAKSVGIGWAVVRNITHQGALGYYALIAADAGLAGIVNTCGTPVMAAHGSRVQAVHNSPTAICVPGQRHRPLLLDMAYSVAAGGKIRHAADSGDSIPLEWALDTDGKPTSDPHRAHVLLPLGGPKGSGVAILFECLSSLLAQNPILSVAIPAMLNGAARDHVQNGLIAAIDIGAFTDPDGFRCEVDRLVDALKTVPAAAGHDEICVPGELGYRTYDERVRDGIPLPHRTIEKLRVTAAAFDVALPAFL